MTAMHFKIILGGISMETEKIFVTGCRETAVSKLFSDGGVQVLKVEVMSGGEIPLHEHECAATMVIIKGRARTLGNNCRIVTKGDVVIKAAKEPHGFIEITEPFEFISISYGAGIIHGNDFDIRYS